MGMRAETSDTTRNQKFWSHESPSVMSVTDHTTTSAPSTPPAPSAPDKKGSRSGLGITALIIAVAVSLFGLLLVPLIAVMFLRGVDSTTQAGEVQIDKGSETDGLTEDIGYAYFGDMEIGQGSSISTVISGAAITRAGDVQVVSMPANGLAVEIAESADGLLLEIAVPDDFPVGPHTVVFLIDGEPEPVSWVFTVLPR